MHEGAASLREARARVAATRAASAAAAAAARPKTEDARAADSKLLQGMHGALQAAIDEVLGALGLAASASELEAAIAAALARRAAAAELALPAGWAPSVAMQRQWVDLLGAPRADDAAAATLGAEGRLLLQLRCALREVPPPQEGAVPSGTAAAPPDASLGSLLVAHTLLAAEGGDGSAAAARLSAALPAYACWRAPGAEFTAGHELLSNAEALQNYAARTPQDST